MIGAATWIAGAGALAGAAWFSDRYAWWRRAEPWDRPRVLMYHMVRAPIAGARFNKLRVAPADFKNQMDWLARNGFNFVFASRLFSPEPLPERTVCITFDDGYADNLTAADPVLAAVGGRATLYLVEDRAGGWSSKKKAHHADDELRDEPKLTDDEVRALLATGRWEIAGHTRTHAHLPSLSAVKARDEIASARSAFAEKFGVRPATFAYPFGVFTDEHAAIVREAGYAGAMTTDPGVPTWPIADPMRVPRVKVSGRDGMFAFRLRMRTGRRGRRS